MATRIPYAFASTGDIAVVPDTSVGTELSIQSGWSSAYELAPEDAGYREIDRGQHNYLWNAITANIKEWQDQSYPDMVSTVNYPVGSMVVYSSLPYVKFQNNDGAISDPSLSNDWKVFDGLSEVSPRNNDWNGYLNPEHQSTLPAPNGYPATSGGGGTAYTADQEISYGIFAGASGATVSSDSDGWIVSAGSIYKLYTYTIEQLADIDVTKVPVYLKDQAGVEYFLKHNGSSIIVTKVGSQLKVEITAAIFAGSFTKLWRFFVTERVGRVVELGDNGLILQLQNELKARRSYQDVSGSRVSGVTYTNLTPTDIELQIWFTGSVGNEVSADLSVDGITVGNIRHVAGPNSPIGTITATVPQGKDYVCNSAFITSWLELRV